jgi:hypothetical protein
MKEQAHWRQAMSEKKRFQKAPKLADVKLAALRF